MESLKSEGKSMDNNKKDFGYLKYVGSTIKEGEFDMRKAGKALIGFDKILRHFIIAQNPEWKKSEIVLPVKVRKGSWEVIVSGLFVYYLGRTVHVAADRGFADTGLARDLKKATLLAKKVVEIAKHFKSTKIGDMEKENVRQLSAREVKLTNSDNQSIVVSKEEYEHYGNLPKNIFSDNTEIVDDDISLEIGFIEGGKKVSVCITEKDKFIFIKKKKELMSELEHGDVVTLQGRIIRVTESRNSIGFRCENLDTDESHNIECKGGDIVRFKDIIISKESGGIFQKVEIIGRVDRFTKKGKPKKISIQIIEIKPLDGSSVDMFSSRK